LKPLPYIVLLTILSHAGFVGSRINVSLTAIDSQASTFTVGVLMSLYAAVPMLVAVSAGRLIDRIGVYRPLLVCSAAVALSILLPFIFPALPMLYVAAVMIGTSFMLQHIALNHLVGFIGDPAERAVNFSWLALGYATSGFIGPLLAGFTIDLVGHRNAFLVLSLPPALAAGLLAWRRPPTPGPVEREPGDPGRDVMDLVRNPKLLPVFLFSGLLATGWDLYAFVMPVYGTSVGLSASTIGVVMSSFALATFVVRLFMPIVSRHVTEWGVICTALVVAGIAYSMFPAVRQVPLLIALSFLLGLGLGCAQPMIMAVLYSASPPGRQGEVVGVRTTLMNASHTFLPLLFGAAGAALGVGPVFWAMAGLLLTGGWLAHRRR